MAAAFALGAEGVLMGTRMLTAAEALVHDNLKQAVVNAAETDTLIINRHDGRPVRVMRTETTTEWEFATEGSPATLLGNIADMYRNGDLETSLPQFGQVAAPHRRHLAGGRDHPADRRRVSVGHRPAGRPVRGGQRGRGRYLGMTLR